MGLVEKVETFLCRKKERAWERRLTASRVETCSSENECGRTFELQAAG